MTLPASGPITFADVNVELGRSSTAALDLNDSQVRTLAGVPSGTISMSDLLGKSWIHPVLTAKTLVGTASGVSGSYTETSMIRFNNDGTLLWRYFDPAQIDSTFSGEWLSGVSTPVAALYSLDAVHVSGTVATGLGTNMALSTTRSITVSRTGYGSNTSNFTCTIKRISDGAVMAGPVNVQLVAQTTP
jgi:hypothetical protein